MMWFTSDHHFGHNNVITYCRRPFGDLKEMHDALIDRWKKKVSPSDLVWVLGDLSFLPYKDFEKPFSELPGHKILVQGNHDHYSVAQYYRLGFEMVVQEAVIKIAGTRVRLSHFPHAPAWWKRPFLGHYAKRFLDRRPPKDGWLLHGHTHGKWKSRGKCIHVGVDAWNFAPVSIHQIEKIIMEGQDGKQRDNNRKTDKRTRPGHGPRGQAPRPSERKM